MSYDPPIRSRTADDLLSIIEKPGDWEEDALKDTREELVKRGYPVETQKRRHKSKVRYKRRVRNIKASASYSWWALALIIVLAPFLVMFAVVPELPSFDTVLELQHEGYEKKWKQRLLAIIVGHIILGTVLYFTI